MLSRHARSTIHRQPSTKDGPLLASSHIGLETARLPLPPTAYRLPSTASARRGVLLLVILILLVLFVMMAVTYVLVATRELSANKALATKDLATDSPSLQLDGAAMQLLVGSTNQHSVIYPHSLLEHMYGPYTALGKLGNQITDATGGQIVEFLVPITNLSPANPAYTLSSAALAYEGDLDGSVITMTSGQAKGLSSRIVRYDVPTATTTVNANPDPVFHILAFKGTGGAVTPQTGDTFIINGRAFSGTGFGFNNGSGILDAKDGDPFFAPGGKEFALLPNPAFYAPAQFSTSNYASSTPFGGLGGGNTDYDAPDYQHMFMSWTVIGANGSPQTILPSYHRPDLINYWHNRMAQTFGASGWTNWSDKTFIGGYTDPNNPTEKITDSQHILQRIMLRPNPIDHPNFTGSNNYLSAANFSNNIAWNPSSGTPCPWDVDNDGDGVADSVWLDLGYPVQTAADGRLYKPLFAILCVDLDGRLNLNAHGTTEQIAATHTQTITDAFAGTSQTVSLPRGEGNGPADVDLQAGGFTTAEISNLLHGGTVNGQTYPGRYGASGQLASSEPIGTAEAGQTGIADRLGLVERFQWTDNLKQPPFSSFGSPGDLWGRMAIGLDFRGQPLFEKPSWTNEAFTNCPYNLNLSAEGSGYDAPFTVHELEHILRPNDEDSGDLPPRLWQLSDVATLAGSSATLPQAVVRAHSVTTDSWDPPSPGVVSPDYLRNELSILYGRKFATNIVELLTARLMKENPTMTAAQVNTNIRRLLSPELIAGLRMNVNRPLGDGRDSDGNSVVDEATTSELNKEGSSSSSNPWTWLDPSLAAFMPAPPKLDLVNGQNVKGPDSDGVYRVSSIDQQMARQLLARHLYVLARLMVEDSSLAVRINWYQLENLTTGRKQMAIRRIAQWAINVVDFQDPDNIMTPFEYDINPFKNDDPAGHPGQTWEVDGIVDSNSHQMGYTGDDNQPWRDLAWGCERPELLLTETLAFHDRRVRDSAFDNGNGKTLGDTPPDATNTYDQVRIPQGSAFFELMCTGNPNQPQQSKDLYDNSTGTWMLDLAKTAPPDNNGNTYPVWRLAITGADSNTKTSTNDVQFQTQPYNNYSESYTYDSESYSSDPANTKAPLPASFVDPNIKNPLLPNLVPNPIIERVVWFTNFDPSSGNYDVPANQIYYRHGGGNSCLLGLGQYAVVGPREITRIGWSQIPDSNPSSVYSAPGYQPARAKIVLQPGYSGVLFTDHQSAGASSGTSTALTNYPDVTSQIQPPLAIIAAANVTPDMPAAWIAGLPTPVAARLDTFNPSTLKIYGIGISVSEPLPGASYYDMPTVQRPAFDSEVAVTDCYANLNELDPSATGLRFLDMPLDSESGKDRPLLHNTSLATGTYINYKTVLLQRLANPLAPFDKLTNPYLTVDWMPIDLTVFNGQSLPSSNADPDDPSPAALAVRFAARQRNGQLTSPTNTAPTSDTVDLASDYNLWMQQEYTNRFVDQPPKTPADPTDTSTGTMIFPHQLRYFKDPTNPSLGLASPNPTTPNNRGLHSFGFVNTYFGPPMTSSQVGVQHMGDPQQPFPWLTWNNRPYANLAELMMVPATHPGRLLHEFSLVTAPGFLKNKVNANENIYNADLNSNQITAPDGTPMQARMPYAHLLNFFGSSTPAVDNEPNLAEMFEYLRVPSPFDGTNTILDPNTFAGDWWTKSIDSSGNPAGISGETSDSTSGAEPIGTEGFHPPFDKISNYRDPGKVNINTIVGTVDSSGTKASSDVWNALIGGDPSTAGSVAPGSTFTDIVSSRQGYAGNLYSFNSANPSIFSNPFRSAAGYDMVPLQSLTPSRPTNVSILRTGMGANGRSITDTNPAGLGVPSAAASSSDNNANVLPLMANKFALTPQATGSPPPYVDGTRNPYFMFQGLGHLTNKLTTRSNVYAVWVTVGYFEVTPWYGTNTTGAANTAGPQVFDTAHPDGYQLGQELKADTGEIERHRAFYIIDRSIPVGFQRGIDLNDDKAVVLKRFIE